MKNILFLVIGFFIVTQAWAQGVDLKGGLQHKNFYGAPDNPDNTAAQEPVEKANSIDKDKARLPIATASAGSGQSVAASPAGVSGDAGDGNARAALEKSLRRIWDKYTSMRDVSDVKSSALQVIDAQEASNTPKEQTKNNAATPADDPGKTPDTGLSSVMKEYNQYKQQRGKMRTLERSMPTDGMRH